VNGASGSSASAWIDDSVGANVAAVVSPESSSGAPVESDISDSSAYISHFLPDGAAVGEGGGARWSMSPEMAKGLDIAISVGGLLVATLLAAALAIIEALYSPLRINGVLVPVSLVVAIATNPLLGWFAITTTKRRVAALLPAGVWCVLWFLAAGRTSEGDLVITQNNWVGLATLFTGPFAFAIGVYISVLRHRVESPRGGEPAGAARAVSGPTGS
jgi:hypothetical protein